MNTPIFIIALIFMLLTLLVCAAGIFLMAMGDEVNSKYGNKLMYARIYLQAITLVLVALAFL